MRLAITDGTAKAADFSLAGSNTQVYTFTPPGTATNIRFYAAEDPQYDGKIVESLTPDGTDPKKVTLVYKNNLNNTAGGKYNTEALKVDIYAVYNDAPDGSGLDRKVKLTASIQDCQCCGAYALDGQWLNFMCHNLGADGTLDPFTWNNGAGGAGHNDIKGYFYQWGRYTDGHQFRDSETASVAVTASAYNDAVAAYKSNNTAIPYSKFYTSSSDWVLDPTSKEALTRWGDGTAGRGATENPPKGPNDPCPPGWKVPSGAQWCSMYRLDWATIADNTSYASSAADANIWTLISAGYMVGDALFLPLAGQHMQSSSVIASNGLIGFYQNSTNLDASQSYVVSLQNDGLIYIADNGLRAQGFSVRCVSE
jgi:uncharacterized protein (TIGR02145 family)